VEVLENVTCSRHQELVELLDLLIYQIFKNRVKPWLRVVQMTVATTATAMPDITPSLVRDHLMLDATLVMRFKAYIRKDPGIVYRIWHVYVKGVGQKNG
jgi:hypothetical protein